MVVQRSWKIQSDMASTSVSSADFSKTVAVGGNSSSEDSNGSNQTTHSIATSVTTSSHKGHEATAVPNGNETIKYVTTPQMAENMLQRLRQRLCPPVTTADNVMHSLDLLRSNLQSTFDKEIDGVVKKFLETYFNPAVKNIKENLGESLISDGMLKKIVCMMLEESKMQYTQFPIKQNLNQTAGKNMDVASTSRFALKRSATKTASSNEIAKKVIANVTVQQQMGNSTSEQVCVRPATESTESTGVRKLAVAQPRRQIFWNTADISTNTNFVLDVQANQAFGFGTDGKERLASKHPELIRYLPDGEDRDWLISQNIISQQNRNSRFLFLIHDEVYKLYQNNDLYKKKPNVSLSVMHTFKVPEFMIQKMKVFFVDLNIKSRGLITNSFCESTSVNQSNSHLRNALLQGAQTSSTTNATAAAAATESCCASSCSNGTSSSTVSNVSTSTESLASGTQLSKSKPSTLSSSHATLTALLNNPNSAAIIKASNAATPSSIEKIAKK